MRLTPLTGLPIIASVSSDDTSLGQRAREELLRAAEQLHLCSQRLAELAQKVATLRERLHRVEEGPGPKEGRTREG